MTKIFSKRRNPVLDFIGQTFLLLSIIVSILYGTGYYPDGYQLSLILKPMPVLLLAVYVIVSMRTSDHLILGLALIMSASADLAIALPGAQSFQNGIIGFTAAHVAYMVLFLKNRQDAIDVHKKPIRLSFLLWVLAFAAAYLFYTTDLDIKWDLISYTFVLTGMVTAALISRYYSWSVGLGAMLFYISDMLLGAHAFLDAPWWVGTMVWTVYYLGQMLIAIGVMLSPDKERRYRSYKF